MRRLPPCRTARRTCSRTGPLVGTLPKILLEQDLGAPVNYVFKVVDTFGQYDEAATAVTVEDTTPPVIGSVTGRLTETRKEVRTTSLDRNPRDCAEPAAAERRGSP
jgi:hypothetical protein